MTMLCQALAQGTLKLVLNRHQLGNILAPAYAARDGAAANEVLDRDLSVLTAAMCRIKDTPWDETVGETVANNCKRVLVDDLPGWEIAVYQEFSRGVPTGRVGTISAIYRDEGYRECRYVVPTVRIWDGRDEVEVGTFVRYLEGECGYCGADMDGQFYCPFCGSN